MAGTIVITGTAGVIGNELARHFHRDGWRVAAIDHDEQGNHDSLATIGDSDRLLPLTADITDENAIDESVDRIVECFGPIDALINNAAIADPVTGPLQELATADWRRVIDTNLTGPFLMIRACAPSLRQQRGAIVNIASTRALQSEPDCEAYAASKGGILALTHALAASLGPAVRVNAISPGWINGDRGATLRPIDHAQHPAGRVGVPADIAATAAFLVGVDAGFITGQNMIVDGGMTRKMIYAE